MNNPLSSHPLLNSIEVHCLGELGNGCFQMEIWIPDETLVSRIDVYEKILDIHLHLSDRSPLTTTDDGLSFQVSNHEGVLPGLSGLAEIGFYVKEDARGIGVYLKDIFDIYQTNKSRPTQAINDMIESFSFGPLSPKASHSESQRLQGEGERPKVRMREGTPAPLTLRSESSPSVSRSEAPIPPTPPPLRREGAPLNPLASAYRPTVPVMFLDPEPQGYESPAPEIFDV